MKKINEECAVFGACLEETTYAPIITCDELFSMRRRDCCEGTKGVCLQNITPSRISVGYARNYVAGSNRPFNPQAFVGKHTIATTAAANIYTTNSVKINQELRAYSAEFFNAMDNGRSMPHGKDEL